MKLDPTLRKFLRIGLIGFGAMAVVSAVVNAVAIGQLIEASDEASLGITRGEWYRTYAVLGLFGAGMIYAGFWIGRVPPPKPPPVVRK